MNEIDWVIIAVLAVSTMVGLFRGIVREIMAIVGWVVAIILAFNFSPMLGGVLPIESLHVTIRTVIAAVLIIVLTLFTCGLLGKLLGHALSAASITFEDRAIGSVFGFVRGVFIVCACVFLFGMTSCVKTGVWRNSVLIVPAERIIDFSIPYFPETISKMRSEYKVY